MRSLIGAGLVLLAVVALAAEAAVKSPPRPDTRAISARIDALVQADLARHNVKPNPPAGDEVFLRRIYLDAIGRIPTVDEAIAFLHSTEPDKRRRLIDQLLDSPGYVSRQYNYWADVLRAKSRLRQGSGLPYIQFIKQSLAANKPYDQFVRELLTAEGPSHARDNGATGYYLRDFNMPEDNMSNTVQVFLGTQMVCAQCHDHPFDKWTQLEFFEMAAFTGGTQTRYNQAYKSPMFARVRQVMGAEADDREMKRAVGKFTEVLRYGVEGSGTGLSRLPKDYQYDDAKPLEVVKAHVMFGQQPTLSYPEPAKAKPQKSSRSKKYGRSSAKSIDSRKTYAQWMTSPDNPRFAQVVANRLWKQAMGRGVVEPVDDLSDSTKPANPELMAYLQGQMVALGYDMKQYLRAIYNSKTYQRRAT
ncbi:MAG: DUF1549 and DUF1553 domain-containing protein, partial [Phycisphaerae bacterium]|nr:DUF1549 and DUF1553 domain-containing protein [Phycisphaerae bacterium]